MAEYSVSVEVYRYQVSEMNNAAWAASEFPETSSMRIDVLLSTTDVAEYSITASMEAIR